MFSILLAAVLPLVNQPFTYVGRIVSFDHVSADAGAVTIWAYNSSGQFVAKSDTFATTESAYNYRLAIPIASQPTQGYATVGEKLTFRLCDSVDGEDFLALVPVKDSAVGNPGERVRCDLMFEAEADGDGGSDQYVRGITQQLPRYRSPAIEEDTPDYLSFTAQNGDVTIGMEWSGGTPTMTHTFEWSADKANWTEFLTGSSNMTVHAGETVYFRRKGEKVTTLNPGSSSYSWQFTMTPESEGATIAAGGNVMSLLDASCEQTEVGASAFIKLFFNCTALTAAPELPATELAERCYYEMFSGCAALTVAPALPATTLAAKCYQCMFKNCDSLTVAPALPATTLAEECYSEMFAYCDLLTVALALPATVLADSCYESMFEGCSSLTVAPALPATTLADICYGRMFKYCSSLTVAPLLPATTLVESCYYDMFEYCTSLTVAPALPATTLAEDCYEYMFFGCTKLNEISVGFSEWRDDLETTYDWVSGVASEGTFRCPRELSQTFGSDRIPDGWTVMVDVFFVDIPTVEHLTASVSTNGVTIESKSYDAGLRYQVDRGATVTVTFGVDDEETYALVGRNPVVIENIDQDVVWGTTEGYPLPQVTRVLGKWAVGEDVTASLYASGVLAIAGTGAMYDFASADDVPWADVVDKVTTVTIKEGVTKVGANAWAGMADAVGINGTALSAVRFLAPGVNSPAPAEPSGAVSGAEPERIKIVDGKVLLGVSVCTNGDLTAATEDWEPAAIEEAQVEEDGTVTLTVPATAEQGFMLLKSKGAAPSNRSGQPDTADIQHD